MILLLIVLVSNIVRILRAFNVNISQMTVSVVVTDLN